MLISRVNACQKNCGETPTCRSLTPMARLGGFLGAPPRQTLLSFLWSLACDAEQARLLVAQTISIGPALPPSHDLSLQCFSLRIP